MGDVQQLATLLTKLAYTVRERQNSFARKRECANTLSALTYEASQGRYDFWDTVPKIVGVLEKLLGSTENSSFVEGEPSSMSELQTTWNLAKSSISKEQLSLLAYIIKYIRFVPHAITKQATTLGSSEYDRGIKIRQANEIVKSLERLLGRTDDVLYLYYLIQVYDTQDGKKALSYLCKQMKQKHGLGVTGEIEALQQTLSIPAVMRSSGSYVDIINQIYDTADQSRELHAQTIDALQSMKRWTEYTILPLLLEHADLLTKQSVAVDTVKDTWRDDYSERQIAEQVQVIVRLIEEEEELCVKIREELGYYMRTNNVLKEIICFTKQSGQQLMSHHADLFGVAVLSYNLFPLLAAFYNVEEFGHYWDAAEDYVLPKSAVRKAFSSLLLRNII